MDLLATAVESVARPRNEVRRIRGLKWAELRDDGPFSKQKPKRRAHKAGIAYEKKVGRWLGRMIREGELEGELRLSQWILFADENGIGWAQPDAYILMEKGILLMECKLTQSDVATPQLLSLYLPLLRKIYNLPILCLQICHNLRYVPKKIVEGPKELLANPGPGVYVWHYIGD